MVTADSRADRQKAFALLGLAPGAGRGAIRRAYRRLAFGCHPDRHPGRPEMERRFKELSEAYRMLLAEAREAPSAAPVSPPERGRDLFFRLHLDFLQAARGGEVPLRYRRPLPCPFCVGEGAEGCPACEGRGEVEEETVLQVTVPAGLDEGDSFRVMGQGAPGCFGGPPGDLFVQVSCGGHPTLRREGLDVYGEVQVPVFRLSEGGPVRVFTVQGSTKIQIPPRTPPGRVFRLDGWGVRREAGGQVQAGDHLVRVNEMPENPETWAQLTSPRYRFHSRS